MSNEKIGKLIRAAGKQRNQMTGDFTPAPSDGAEKVAIEGGPKTPGTKPMQSFDAQKVISSVNDATDLDAKLKAYTASSGYTTMDQKTDGGGK